MKNHGMSRLWVGLPGACLLVFALAGCGGGATGVASPAPVDAPTSGIATGSTGLAAASNLTITVTKVSINSPPVVEFTVANEARNGMTGLVAADLRFNIAKLVPVSNGEPARWQNYINRARSGAVQGSQERAATGYVFGTLVGLGSGRYTYTFATDITSPAANPCPAPCTDAVGKALDITYAPTATHRVTIQQANSAYPEATGVLDFVPASGIAVQQREVVSTATCNGCHGELSAHGTRVDTKLCVTCHNPGSWVAGAPATTVDFKTMVHRIHYNTDNTGTKQLPSVIAGVPYKIGTTDFSKVVFTQDARNCTRCHDGTPGAANVTAQGNNWKTEPSIEACGSCHDNVYFGAVADVARPYQTKAHSGGVMTDNSTCASCHAAGSFTDKKDIVVAHNFPSRFKAAAAKFQYKILSVSPTTAGSAPVITFSVTDPTNGGLAYDIKTAKAFTTGGGVSRLALSIAWSTKDFDNGASGQSYGQPVNIDALGAGVTCNASFVCTATSPVVIPAGQTGTLRVTVDGHPAGDVTTAGTFTDRLMVKSVFKDAAITGSVAARRTVVDITKCNACHDILSLHGNNRTDEIQVCAACHNASATDAARRPNAAGVLTGGVDGKLEESIDLKTMIHGIHAGQSGKGGFRTKGITVYGFGGSVNDFSSVAFPGRVSDCAACHVGDSYQLSGLWATPTASGILGNTVSTGASASDPSDNLRISPTAAVCASCHDGTVAKAHMQDVGSGASFSATQAALNTTVVENCTLCHGPGRVYDVKLMHRVK